MKQFLTLRVIMLFASVMIVMGGKAKNVEVGGVYYNLYRFGPGVYDFSEFDESSDQPISDKWSYT